ncbi:MAG TPA: type 4a pilus biogenesis protein PilO, partial [Thermoanaerobaculia bacterium]|nr:type 4a pilus biogenesis protein PilO [Thermoanaerobaculia bacterium]
MAVKTGLEGKPWYFGLGVGLGIGALIFGAVSWRVLQPMRDQLASGQAQLAELQTKIQEGRAAKQQLPKFREEVHQLEMELDKLLRILPARRNTPDLLRRIRSLAEQGDF